MEDKLKELRLYVLENKSIMSEDRISIASMIHSIESEAISFRRKVRDEVYNDLEDILNQMKTTKNSL